MKTLPYTTPSGYTYAVPDDWNSLQNLMMNHLQSIIECWAEEGCPPDPTADSRVSKVMWNLIVRAQEEFPYAKAWKAS